MMKEKHALSLVLVLLLVLLLALGLYPATALAASTSPTPIEGDGELTYTVKGASIEGQDVPQIKEHRGKDGTSAVTPSTGTIKDDSGNETVSHCAEHGASANGRKDHSVSFNVDDVNNVNSDSEINGWILAIMRYGYPNQTTEIIVVATRNHLEAFNAEGHAAAQEGLNSAINGLTKLLALANRLSILRAMASARASWWPFSGTTWTRKGARSPSANRRRREAARSLSAVQKRRPPCEKYPSHRRRWNFCGGSMRNTPTACSPPPHRRDVPPGLGGEPTQKDPAGRGTGTHPLPRPAPHLRDHGAPKRRGHKDRLRHTGPLRRRVRPPHLYPRHKTNAGAGGGDHGRVYGAGHVAKKTAKAPGGRYDLPPGAFCSFPGLSPCGSACGSGGKKPGRSW